jgi:hypothetical protein
MLCGVRIRMRGRKRYQRTLEKVEAVKVMTVMQMSLTVKILMVIQETQRLLMVLLVTQR